jgi:hypothetical protein
LRPLEEQAVNLEEVIFGEKFMPELGWRFGYGVAAGTMAVV